MLPVAATVSEVKLQARLQLAAAEAWLQSLNPDDIISNSSHGDGGGSSCSLQGDHVWRVIDRSEHVQLQQRSVGEGGAGVGEVQEWLAAAGSGFGMLSMWEEAEGAWQLLALLCQVLKQRDRSHL
jgi:hypothetical protein